MHMSGPDPAEQGRQPALRHPAEVPLYLFLVVLDVVIVAVILRFAAVLPFVPERLQESGWALAIRGALLSLLLFIPGLLIAREIQRASVRASAVQLSRSQFPDIYATAAEFAAVLRLRRLPQLYLTNGNGH